MCILLLTATAPHASAATAVEVRNFGSNPGNLRMFKYIPDQLPTASAVPLVDRLHIALVMPQQDQNNSCFNWFLTSDNRRDQGQALSIKQMVDKMKSDHNIDPKRVFVTGLSGGGAMTSVMLATYPEIFAAGGIVAGLPYGCANSQTDAFLCMSTGHPLSSGLPVINLVGMPGGQATGMPGVSALSVPLPPGVCLFFPILCQPQQPPAGPPLPIGSTLTPQQLGDFVRHASNSVGPFPRVSIWHGSSDSTVSPVNASEEMQQWTNVHGISQTPAVSDTVKGFPHQVFKDASGNAIVETFGITGMGHGVPVDPGSGADQCGSTDPFVLDVHICSSLFIARFWASSTSEMDNGVF
jgi:poly(3-hydroxybutyrate) depolymerase